MHHLHSLAGRYSPLYSASARRHTPCMAASTMPQRLYSILEMPHKHKAVLMDQFGVSLPP